MRKIDDLLSHVTVDDDCWLWRGGKRAGYGRIRRNGVWYSVHIVVYEQHVRKLLPGEVIRHKCNRRACIRLDHLEPGTQQENVFDSIRAGTHHNPAAKLKADDVKTIRKLAGDGQSPSEIAELFNVQATHIKRIVKGERWSNV